MTTLPDTLAELMLYDNLEECMCKPFYDNVFTNLFTWQHNECTHNITSVSYSGTQTLLIYNNATRAILMIQVYCTATKTCK